MRQVYSKKQWIRLQGSKKLNRAIKSLWNRCMKLKPNQASPYVTFLISGNKEMPAEVNSEVNTLELVISECGTRKEYSEYEQYKELMEMATKVNWQERFKDAKIRV
jgi:hypothetical protein